MADFKVIEKTLQSGSNILEVTDASLNNDSIFEVYTDDVNVIPVGVTVSGTTASITFDSKPTTATGVKIFINNLEGEYTPSSGDRVEITDAVQYGSLICKISVNGEVTEIRSGTISANNVRYYDSQGSDMTQFEFNNSVVDRLDNLDASDILYDENSTVYSAMGDIDSLTTTSKNLVGAINEVSSSGGSTVYSETETIIGTYKGQTLYRRCISGTLTQPDTHTDLTDITGSFNVINWGGYYTISSGIRVYTGYASNSAYFSLYYHISGNCYRLYHPVRNNEINTFDIFIEYTKVV